MENIRHRNKILALSFLAFFVACNSISDYSFENLLKAFNSWSSIHSNELSDNLDSKNFFIRNKRGTSEYFSEYSFDLKRFKLELFQIDKKNLNNKNKNIHLALSEKINSLLYSHSYNSYSSNPVYYIDPLNDYILNLLLSKDLNADVKSEYIDDVLTYIPFYFNRAKKTLLFSNDYYMKRVEGKINITKALLESIPLYIDFNDTLFIEAEKKIYNNTQFLESYKNWLRDKIDNDESIEKNNISEIVNSSLFDLEDKYNYSNVIDSLELTIKKLKKNVLNSASILYSTGNSKITFENYNDSLSSVYYILDQYNQTSNFSKDHSSQVIYFNEQYKKILSSFDITNIDPLHMDFPYYNTFFELFDESIFMINPYYNHDSVNIIISSYSNSDLFKTDTNIFLVEEILSRSLYFNSFSNKQVNIYNDINHYSWSKFLSAYMIYKEHSIVDESYKLLYNLNLLHDFLKILIKYKYYNEEINKEDAVLLLLNDGFINKELSSILFEEIIYNYNDNDLEKFIAYTYIYDLFDEYCIINKTMSETAFIKNFFKYGFLPIYNYKTVLN